MPHFTRRERVSLLRWSDADTDVLFETFSLKERRRLERLLPRLPGAQIVTNDVRADYFAIRVPLKDVVIFAPKRRLHLSSEQRQQIRTRLHSSSPDHGKKKSRA